VLRWNELKKTNKKKLEAQAAATFDQYIDMRGLDYHAILVETQAYQSELRQREERRSRRFDLLLEFVIIALIGWEIYEGYQQARILEHLDQSSAATAQLLKSLQPTLEAMNGTLATQLQQANQVSIEGSYDGAILVTITNKGRPSVSVYGTKVGNSSHIESLAGIIPAGNEKFLRLFDNPTEIIRREIGDRIKHTLPIEIYLESDDGTQYVATATVTGTRNPTSDALTVVMSKLVVTKRNWRK
jgi:hypothetical protein